MLDKQDAVIKCQFSWIYNFCGHKIHSLLIFEPFAFDKMS